MQLCAAFDFGSGATKLCLAAVHGGDTGTGTGTTGGSTTTRKIDRILYVEECEVLLGDSKVRSATGTIDEETIKLLFSTVEHFLSVIDSHRTTLAGGGNITVEMCGVATSVYRSASNGPRLLQELATHYGIPARVIAQEEEAFLGLFTGRAALQVAHPTLFTTQDGRGPEIVVWDSGGASFQLIHPVKDKGCVTGSGERLETLLGHWGSSSSVHAMLTKTQGKTVGAGPEARMSPNPVSREEFHAHLNYLKESIQSDGIPEWLPSVQWSSDGGTRLVGIGGPTCAFRMSSLAVGCTQDITPTDIVAAAEQYFCGKENDALRYRYTEAVAHTASAAESKVVKEALAARKPGDESTSLLFPFVQPEMVLPKLALVTAVLLASGAPSFSYYPTTGCTLGLLLHKELWNDIVSKGAGAPPTNPQRLSKV